MKKQLATATKVASVLLGEAPKLMRSPFGKQPCEVCGRKGDKMAHVQGRGKAITFYVCGLRCRNRAILDRFARLILRPGHGVEPDPRFDVRATDTDGESVTPITKWTTP